MREGERAGAAQPHHQLPQRVVLRLLVLRPAPGADSRQRSDSRACVRGVRACACVVCMNRGGVL